MADILAAVFLPARREEHLLHPAIPDTRRVGLPAAPDPRTPDDTADREEESRFPGSEADHRGDLRARRDRDTQPGRLLPARGRSAADDPVPADSSCSADLQVRRGEIDVRNRFR